MGDIHLNVDIRSIRDASEDVEDLVKHIFKKRKISIYRDLADFYEPYVPKRTGDLRAKVSINENGITYTQPYAQLQYETQFEHYTTPGTGPAWDEQARADNPGITELIVELNLLRGL